jgi:hypothetical protein
MLVAAAFAGIWSKPPGSLRSAVLVLGAVAVFALVSWGVGEARQTGTRAPESIVVAGQPYSLQRGKILLFFFHPECMHCYDASKRMSQLNWGDTKVVAVPVDLPQFAAPFLKETGLQAVVYPFGVALENGRQKMALTKFEQSEPVETLKRLNFVH